MKKSIVGITTACLLLFAFACSNYAANKSSNDAVPATAHRQQRMEENKALVLKFYQALNDTNWSQLDSLIGRDYKHYFVVDTGFASIPWRGFEKGFRASLKAFPDWKLSPQKMIAEDDFVSVLLNGSGTHLGEFAGIAPTHMRAKAPVMLMHQIKDGKIVADWEIMNTGLFLKQLKKQ